MVVTNDGFVSKNVVTGSGLWQFAIWNGSRCYLLLFIVTLTSTGKRARIRNHRISSKTKHQEIGSVQK